MTLAELILLFWMYLLCGRAHSMRLDAWTSLILLSINMEGKILLTADLKSVTQRCFLWHLRIPSTPLTLLGLTITPRLTPAVVKLPLNKASRRVRRFQSTLMFRNWPLGCTAPKCGARHSSIYLGSSHDIVFVDKKPVALVRCFFDFCSGNFWTGVGEWRNEFFISRGIKIMMKSKRTVAILRVRHGILVPVLTREVF